MPRVAALLAAGAGARFEGSTHKLRAQLNGRPLWEWAVAAVQSAGFDHVLVVTGAAEVEWPSSLILRHNPAWATGQASSVQVAARAARELGADTLTIGLADQPFVTSAAWRAVADAPSSCRIVVATYDGVSGPNPVRLHRDVWTLLPSTGDEGARGVIRAHPEWVCPVACVGSVADIDTLEDLARWNHC
jgi:CTP:molybdopterin cytidylyltransferase MocA